MQDFVVLRYHKFCYKELRYRRKILKALIINHPQSHMKCFTNFITNRCC